MSCSKVFKICFFLIICLSSVISLQQPKCRGKEVYMSKEDMKEMVDCIKEAYPKDGKDSKEIGVSEEKMACLGKCILTKEGLIDDKGMPSKDNMMSKLNATMPQEVMEDLDTVMGKCIEDHGKTVLPNDTSSCMSYQPLSICIHMVLVEVCKEKEKM